MAPAQHRCRPTSLLKGEKIALINASIEGKAAKEIDATGMIITPGFVDVHTHYDGQATWDTHLNPSSNLGTTTVVMGNCGVGFVPRRPEDRDVLVKLMEGVEEIPESAMSEGLPWTWETFPEFLDCIESRPHDIDLAALVPHGPLRVYVMGERGVNREPATADDIAKMKELLAESVAAGGVGFSTSRTLVHRSSTGDFVPTYQAVGSELVQITQALAGIRDMFSNLLPTGRMPMMNLASQRKPLRPPEPKAPSPYWISPPHQTYGTNSSRELKLPKPRAWVYSVRFSLVR